MLGRQFAQKAKAHNSLRNQSGQAVIEYILVLCITVMLILTFVYQFSTAFRSYANNFFDGYISCLLETGELPGGGGNCADEWKAFSLADGKTASGGSATSGSGSSSSTGSKSGSSSSSKSKNAKTEKKPSSSSSSSSSASTSTPSNSETGPNGGSSNSPGHRHQRSTAVATSSPQGGSDNKGKEGLTPLGPVSGNYDSHSNSAGKRTRLASGFGYEGQQQNEDREKDRPATKAIGKDESNSLKPQKVAVPTTRAPASKADDGGGGFSLGNFIRILLIVGILVLIFILFGSQILAISKSGEK